MDKEESRYIAMTENRVDSLVLKMAVPSIISMLVSAIYNIVDTAFVGRISTEATAGVGVVFSYMTLIQAIAFFFGHGSAAFISRALGKRDKKGAESVAATGFYFTVLTGIVIAIFGFIFSSPILYFLGSTDSSFLDASAYFKYILLGTPFIMGSYTINLQMRMQGNATLSMIGIASGALLNVLLDPLFIFVLKMETAGAALATAISQIVSFTLLLILCRVNDGIKLSFSSFKPKWWHFKEITASGFPSLMRQGLQSVSVVALNRIASLYGDAALASFSIVGKIFMFSTSIILGFGQGFQPVCGFNYGAKKYDRVKKAFWFSAIVATLYCILMTGIGLFFSGSLIALFRNDSLVIAYGTRILRAQCLAYPFVGFVIITNMYLQNIRKPVAATLIASSRQGMMFLPSLFILHALFGLTGASFSQATADFLSFFLALPLAIYELKKMK